MLEIGSEFWKVDNSTKKNRLFPSDTKWFLSGQNALNFIIDDIKSKHDVSSVALPSWCCDSMIIPFIINDFDISFYDIELKNGNLVQKIDKECDVILAMDYFGYESSYNLSNYNGIVIRDLTHSIFIKEYKDATYYFGSLRKWTGVYTGGYAWSNEKWTDEIPVREVDRKYVSLRCQAMKQKRDYIEGLTKSKGYLEKYEEAEDVLDECNLKGVYNAERADILAAQTLDIDKIKKKRRENAKELLKSISDIALFPEISDNDCPLFVPIIIKCRDELKKTLIGKGVYCPVHWPISKHHILTNRTREIYEKELSIVCDQRYSTEDMKKISCLIKEYMEK